MTRPPRPWLWSASGTAAVLLVTSALLTWSHPPLPEPLVVSLGTGGEGGVYHAYGSGLSGVSEGIEGVDIVTHATAASVENNRLVASGAMDAAFTLSDVAALAVAGEPPFEEPLPIRAIARLYDNHTHVVVRADSPYEEIADLSGATVSLGASGSGTEMMAERLLDLAGLEQLPADADSAAADGDAVAALRLSIERSAQALEEGSVDALFWSGGLPTQAVADLAERHPVRLLDLSEHVPALVEAYGGYFAELPVPAGTYPGVPAVRTIGVPSLLVVDQRMSDDVARDLTALLFEARGALSEAHPVALHLHPRSAIATLPVPLHPGAAAYYRSVKYAYDP
jgi:TRAP transporter TAXI family solute receptor